MVAKKFQKSILNPVGDKRKHENCMPNGTKKQKKTDAKQADIREFFGEKKKVETGAKVEHVLLHPDTYVGSTEAVTQPMCMFDAATNKMMNSMLTPTKMVPVA